MSVGWGLHLKEHTPGLIVAVQHAVLQIPPSVGEHEHGVQLATAQDSCQGMTAPPEPPDTGLAVSQQNTEGEKKKERNAMTNLFTSASPLRHHRMV